MSISRTSSLEDDRGEETSQNGDSGGHESARSSRGMPSLSTMILLGLAAGVACGILFGEYCARLSIVGEAFVGLLRMTVLPYIMVSLVANLGRLSLRQSRLLAGMGGLVLVVLWGIGLLTVFALANSFPAWKSGSFFSSSITSPPERMDLLSIFIPANIFAALARNDVPAVIVLCIALGLALAGMEHRETLIAQLDILAKVLIRISMFVTRLAPVGVFAIAASTAGTMRLDELHRLQAYFMAYAAGVLFLGFAALPLLVTTCTPFRYRDVMAVSKDAMVTAFATGKLIVVLPLLIEHTEKLFERVRSEHDNGTVPAVDVLYPIAYPFPHVGKLLGLLFIPFAAWFLGNSLRWSEYPSFLTAGLFSYFGGPILATPFLLDQMHLPHDMFQLFLLSGVLGERLGDALGAVHLATFTLLTTSAFLGHFRVRKLALLQYLLTMTVLGVMIAAGVRMTLGRTLPYMEGKKEILAHMQLLEDPVPSVIYDEAFPNPDPLLPGESLLERVRRRGKLRVGFSADALPFAYYNVRNELVGFDINVAHALARDLDVELEFVPFDRQALARQLDDDDFDLVMSGLVGTLERAETMQHTAGYLNVTLALVVPDYRARDFRSAEAMQRMKRVRIGFVDLSRESVARMRELLPDAEFIELSTNRSFFEENADELDGLLISAECGSAFTLLYPDYEVVVPETPRVSLPLIYAIGGTDGRTRYFIEHWVELRRKDGTMQTYYDHWILGKTQGSPRPRWSVIRDVLGWVE